MLYKTLRIELSAVLKLLFCTLRVCTHNCRVFFNKIPVISPFYPYLHPDFQGFHFFYFESSLWPWHFHLSVLLVADGLETFWQKGQGQEWTLFRNFGKLIRRNDGAREFPERIWIESRRCCAIVRKSLFCLATLNKKHFALTIINKHENCQFLRKRFPKSVRDIENQEYDVDMRRRPGRGHKIWQIC